MRIAILAMGLALAACASSTHVSISTLGAADATTTLLIGETLTQEISAEPGRDGMDPVVTLTLRHTDGRTLRFQQANHTENDLRAQRAGGALSQIMGLYGEETPLLYYKVDSGRGTPFICGAEGPYGIGVYESTDRIITIVGLKQPIQFETRPDGVEDSLPYSPDQVCARLRFNAG